MFTLTMRFILFHTNLIYLLMDGMIFYGFKCLFSLLFPLVSSLFCHILLVYWPVVHCYYGWMYNIMLFNEFSTNNVMSCWMTAISFIVGCIKNYNNMETFKRNSTAMQTELAWNVLAMILFVCCQENVLIE